MARRTGKSRVTKRLTQEEKAAREEAWELKLKQQEEEEEKKEQNLAQRLSGLQQLISELDRDDPQFFEKLDLLGESFRESSVENAMAIAELDELALEEAVDLIPGAIRIHLDTAALFHAKSFDFPVTEVTWKNVIASSIKNNDVDLEIELGNMALNENGELFLTEQGKQNSREQVQGNPELYLRWEHPEKHKIFSDAHDKCAANIG